MYCFNILKNDLLIACFFRNTDNLCCARAIAVAIERFKALEIKPAEVNCYEDYKRANNSESRPTAEKLLTEAAETLHDLAGVPLDKGCGVEELNKFQRVLPKYCIRVFSATSTPELIYKGPPAERNIFLILDQYKQHYNVISGPLGFFGFRYYCLSCDKPYSHRNKHSCKVKCPCCFECHSRAEPSKFLKCTDCNRSFWNKSCLNQHKLKGKSQKKNICELVRRCNLCGFSGPVSGHQCGTRCKHCYVYYKDAKEHKCFIAPKKIKSKIGQQYIFFDLEAQFVDTTVPNCNVEHSPILIVAHRVCGSCADNILNVNHRTDCPNCTEHSFKGQDFIEWLFNGRNFDSTVIAHNFKGYDGVFILKKLIQLGKSPTFACRGSQILEITIPKVNIRFIDSLSFLLKPLSKLPAMFGLTELKKGYFPYNFCIPKNMDYVGTYPAQKYYSPERMKGSYSEKTGELTGDIKDFEAWYAKNKHGIFDMQKEMLEYCTSDVVILKQACLHFRKNFMNDTGIDPFLSNITISQLCMDYFRSTHLEHDTIAIIPPNGYHNEDRQSSIALKWLKYLEKKRGISLVYKGSRGEKRVGKYKVDGYDPTNNIVFEFLGNYWHGNLNVYPPETVNKTLGKTMGLLNEETMNRLNAIRKEGFKVEYIWEKDFLADPDAKNFIRECEVVGPLNPRDAFMGGRTNCAWLKYEAKEGEKLRYYDFCSLYPFINKYGKYPLNHPTIILENFGDLSQYYGLIKCRVLPPRELYLPVLPSRFENGKLVFTLCGMCASKCLQEECIHTDTERALLGTWTTPELMRALEEGYKVQEVFEVWDFTETSQCNPETGQDGIFTGYINKFMFGKYCYSGWPPNCSTDFEKESYIQAVFEHEGIKLTKEAINFNPGLREQSKIMLNSFWGKFGQKCNLSKKKVVNTRADFLDLICDRALSVESVVELSPESVMVTYKENESFIEGGPSSNIIIACFTTSLARLKLYDLISRLGTRALYWDTDSCIWVDTPDPDEFKPSTGNFLGDLTDELPEGRYIKQFYSGGPKNYCYIMDDFNSNGCISKCVIKGISMNFSNCNIITPNEIASKIENYVLKGDGSNTSFYKTDRFFYRSPDLSMYMINHEKHYRIMYDKRRYFKDFSTKPYGYKNILSD